MAKGLVLFLSLVLSLWVYRKDLAGVPRADHLWLMAEREHVPTEGKFLWNALSFNRTRHIAPGDYSLFRPAMTGLLALQDIFFREHFYVIGVLSVLAHALVIFSLYILLAPSLGWGAALCFALTFGIQHPGSLMILWRHISPYMGALIFFCLGWITFPRRYSAFLFFLACLFHESVPLTLLAVAILFFIQRKREKGILLGAPVALFYFLNALSYYAYKPGGWFGKLTRDGLRAVGEHVFFPHLLKLWGMVSVAFFSPEAVNLTPQAFVNRPYHWEWSPGLESWFLWIGILGLLLFAWAFYRERRNTVAVAFSLWLAILLFGLAASRMADRSLEYIQISPYYFYLTSFFLTVILAAVFLNSSILVRRGILIFICLNAVFSYVKIQGLLDKTGPEDARRAAVVAQIASYLDKNPEQCFAGTKGDAIAAALPPRVFYRRSCDFKAKKPVFFSLNAKMEIETAALANPKPAPGSP